MWNIPVKNYFQCVKCIFQTDKDDKNYSDHGIMDPPQLNSNICGTDYLEIKPEGKKKTNRRLMEYLSWDVRVLEIILQCLCSFFNLQAVLSEINTVFCSIELQNILVISQYQRKILLYWTKTLFLNKDNDTHNDSIFFLQSDDNRDAFWYLV